MSSDSAIETKTPNKPKAPPNLPVKQKLEKKYFYNALNNYRSYSPVFTISSLDKSKVNKPETYRQNNDLGNIILKSSGKAQKGQSPDFKKLSDTAPGWVQDELDYFNKESAGKYDFYINNVEITTIPVPQKITGTALVTKILFDIHEPYSVVGFIEALTAGARSAGYLHYLDAVFLLKIEFMGYRDDDSPTAPAEPEKINLTTRYIPFRFTKVDINFDQSGTIYRCEAVPAEDISFSDVLGSTKTTLQLTGLTVKEILQNMVDGINKTVLDEAKKSAPDIKDTQVDRYSVSFPSYIDGKWTEEDNEIANKKLKELYTDTGIYSFDDVDKSVFKNAYQTAGGSTSTQATTFVPYEPTKWSVNFGPGTSVQSMIDGIVRDSEYWREQVDPSTANLNTKDNFVNFWRITAEIKEGDFNPIRKRPRYEITYKVIIAKIHKTQVPGFKNVTISSEGINVAREYNYLYTGQNIDIKNLRVNFDKLFYERFPFILGSNQLPADSAQNLDNSIRAQQIADEVRKTIEAGGSLTQISNTAVAPGTGAPGGEAASSGLAANMQYPRESFAQILASNFSMIKVDMEIVGDPVYLMTGGLGNYYPALLRENDADYQVFTIDGEANFLPQNVYIKIYFRNPTDVDEVSLENGGTGLVKFRSRYDLSGYYMLVKVISYFRNGEFTQKLELVRAQVELSTNDYRPPEVDTTKLFKTVPDEKKQVRKDAGENKIVPPNQRGSLKDLINGVNNFADSIKNLEDQLTADLEGAITGVTDAIGQVAAVPAQIVGQVTNKIEGALKGIDDTVTDAADRFRLSPSQLSSLSAGELLALVSLSKLIPENVDFSNIDEKGIIVSKKNLGVLPAAQTKKILSDTKQSIKEFNKQNQKEFTKVLEQIAKDSEERIKNLNLEGDGNG